MKAYWIVGGVVAALSSITAGCGGGPCNDYCGAALECFSGNTGCSEADLADAEDQCVNACESSLEGIDSADRGPIQDCLACVSEIFADKCEIDGNSVLANCSNECLNINQAAFEGFNDDLVEKLEGIEVCTEQDDEQSGG